MSSLRPSEELLEEILLTRSVTALTFFPALDPTNCRGFQNHKVLFPSSNLTNIIQLATGEDEKRVDVPTPSLHDKCNECSVEGPAEKQTKRASEPDGRRTNKQTNKPTNERKPRV